jgi:3-dehydroquinate dehydratase-1
LLKLGEKPLIAIPVDDKDFENVVTTAKEKGADIIELRIDQFKDRNIDYISEKISFIKELNLGIIATIRSFKEGGTHISDYERERIYKAIAKDVDIIDIELSSETLRDKVIKLAKENNALALISYHDFEKTPSEEEIQKIIDKAHQIGADIIKYAFKVKNKEDVSRILCITNKNKDKKIIAIGMGELGRITRVAGFFFGSVITYSYIGVSFAPGQIEIEKLKDELYFYNLLEEK